jgi:hypothetical protein
LDDDVVDAGGDLMPGYLVRWIVALELLGIIALGIVLGTRGCLP